LKRRFCSINEYPQSLDEVTRGKRKMNTPFALEIEKALEIEEEFFMTLPLFFEIKEEKKKQPNDSHPDFTMLRPVPSRDTKMEKIAG
jgi:plasmid maintenance system antidote protein VapI